MGTSERIDLEHGGEEVAEAAASVEKAFEGKEVPPWERQVTVRSMVV